MNKKLIGILTVSAVILPLLASAAPAIPAAPAGGLSIDDVIGKILDFAWKILVAIGVLMMIVAGIMFVTAQGDPEKVGKARSAMIWGVAGIVVGIIAFSIFTIVGGAIGQGG